MNSKQKIFCNACGKEENKILPGIGRTYKVCSMRCLNEMQWRDTLSLLNKEYYPDPREFDKDGYEVKKDATKGKDNP